MSKLKLDLNIFKILLNPKGSINNREFLVGISTLFLISIHQSLIHAMSSSVITSIIAKAGGNVINYATSRVLPDIFMFPSISLFVVFVSCLGLTYKRAVDLSYKIATGLVFGIIIYLGFSFNFHDSVRLINAYSSDMNILNRAGNYMTLYSVIGVIITLLSVGLIIYLSTQKGNKDSSDYKNATSRYIFNLSKAVLFLIAYSVALGLFYYFLANPYLIQVAVVLFIIPIPVFLIYYLYLNYKKSKGVRFLFWFNLILLIMYFAIPAVSVFMAKFYTGIAMFKIYTSLLSIINMLFTVSNASFIVVEPYELKV